MFIDDQGVAISVLIAAAFLDFVVGDPWSWPHPVQAMGWWIEKYSSLVLNRTFSVKMQRFLGMILTVLLVLGSAVLAKSLLAGVSLFSQELKWFVEVVMLASCFAGRSLRRAADDVLVPLVKGETEQARSRLKLYVGRETEHLDRPEILRAVLETVSENAVDGVMAPLFFALLGLFLPEIGPVPLAIAYKASSTLDSMVGYQTSPYTYLGFFSAKTDDVLTWIPCRLTVMTLGILSAQPLKVWRLCGRDARQDPSPNSGWSECAYAAALGVRLGGMNIYRGVQTHKPYMGDALQPISIEVIQKALRFNRYCFILWIILAVAILWAMNHA